MRSTALLQGLVAAWGLDLCVNRIDVGMLCDLG